MYYAGESNVPGAPGNLMAGSPGYFMGDKEIQNRLFKYGMDNTPRGTELKQRMEQLRNQLSPSNTSMPLAQGISGDVITPGMGGAPGQTFDPAYLKNLQQQGSPMPSGLRQQIYPGTQSPTLPQAYGNGVGVYGSSTPMGNAGFFLGPQLAQQGPYTPLPAPGWNPGMIKAPGDPNFRPTPVWEKPGPTPGSTIPWQAAGFQNKMVS